MISILIPVYNWDVSTLILQLEEQCSRLEVPYEIIVIDDCSDDKFLQKNEKIGVGIKVQYEILDNNIGRAAIRNHLAKKATFDWLLFLDSDGHIIDDQFISKYIEVISSNNCKVVCGGRSYQMDKPDQRFLLHWRYGRRREAISAVQRSINPDWYTHTSNLLVAEDIWQDITMDETISSYGYEDIVWGQRVSAQGYDILHIDNPILHVGLKSNLAFIEDVKSSVNNLVRLHQKGSIRGTRLLRAYYWLSTSKLLPVFVFVMRRLRQSQESTLMRGSGSLIALDALKLYYLALAIEKVN